MQMTTAYAHEVAQLKARLMEKDAQLMGGFGNPVKLAKGDWSEPPFTPASLNSRTGSEQGAFGSNPFGFEAFLRSQAAATACALATVLPSTLCGAAKT